MSRFCLRNLDQEHGEDYLLSKVELRGRQFDNASYSAITCSSPPELMPAGQEGFSHEIIKYRNGNSESSVICQYVCQSVLFV